jgi:hypothetical protein
LGSKLKGNVKERQVATTAINDCAEVGRLEPLSGGREDRTNET